MPSLIPSFTQQQRDLLRRFGELTAERARREDMIAQAAQDALVAANRELAARRADADAQLAKELKSSELEHRALSGRIAGKFAADHAAAVAARDAQVREYTTQTNVMEVTAKERGEEKAWLADTLLESAGKKIRQDFDAARAALESRSKELAGMEAQAQALLKAYKHAPLPTITRETDAAGADPRADLEQAGSEALLALDLLGRRVRPFVMNPGFIIGAAALAAVGAAIGGASVIKPVSAGTIGGGAGTGIVATLIVFAVLRVALRARVKPAAEQLASALSRAAGAGKRCLKDAEAVRDASLAAAKTKRDGEVKTARERLDAERAEIDRRRTVEEPALRARHAETIAAIEAKAQREQDAADAARASRQSAAEKTFETAAAQADEDHARATRIAKATQQHDHAALVQEFTQSLEELALAADAIRASADALCPSWDLPRWQTFAPVAEVPPVVSFGSFEVDLASLPGGVPPWYRSARPTRFRLPLVLDLHEKASLLLRYNSDGRAAALTALNNTMMRLLTAFPPAKVRFTLLDPVGLGQSFAAFMHLADHNEQLVSDRIWTEPRQIEQKLGELTEHMETVIQKYLRNEFGSIQEYNEQAGEVAEPYRFLVIADFPANLTEQAAKRLASIVSSGPRCGVYTLIAHDARTKPAAWLPTAEMAKAAVMLSWRDGRFVHQDEDFAPWPATLEAPPNEDTTTRLLTQIGQMAKDLGKVRVPFEMVAPPPGQEWSLSTADQVRIPLGRAGATKLQYLTLGQGTAQHALIAGRTGSGKSTLLHVIITNLGLWCSPDEVELYLVDFKKGVEFKAYATQALPHARVIAVESEREFGLSVLRRLDGELTRRGQLFRDLGVQDLAAYRRAARERSAPVNGAAALPVLPRTLLIVDEFQEFFVEDDKLAQEAALLMDRLVRQGRAFGMHVILGSQTLGGAYSLARSTLGQMAVRIALQCSEADSYLIMAEDNNAPRLLNRPGEAIYNDASGMLEGNSPFQIVWLSEETRETRLASIRHRAEPAALRGEIVRRPPAIVFEGNIPADIRRNHVLAALLAGETKLSPNAAPNAWLGDAVSIKDPTSMVFRRQSASNLLIIGQQEDAATALLVSSAVSLAAHKALAPQLIFFDSTPADSADAMVLSQLAERLGGANATGPRPFSNPRSAGATVAQIADELAAREANPANNAPPMFLIIMGLHRFRDIRKSDDFSFGGDSDKPAPDKQFARILRDGPAVGIHTIAWCDTAANLERTLERQTIREFEARVLFQVSANDSTQLIDSPAAATLGRYRALLYREELGTIEKFRPYALPPEEWKEAALGQILG
ncbi:MAG: cell division protein FtsK [Planctomycetes bacterium]|nr:cell division protein FtsK [Planctomycetota bacterium]